MRKVRKSPSKGRSERPSKAQLSPGMVSHLKAKYAMLCAQAIAESDLQHSLAEKPGMSKAELIATDLVLQFLQNKSLDMTAQTLKAEAGYAIDRSFGNRWIARQLEVRGREKVLNGLLVLKREGRFHIGLRKRRESAEPLAIEDATSMRERRIAIKGRKAMKRQRVPAESGKSPKLPRRPRRAMQKVPSPVPVEVEPVEEDVLDEEIFGSSDAEGRRRERESDEDVDRSNRASTRSKSSTKSKKRGGRDVSESESDEDLNRSHRSHKSSARSKSSVTSSKKGGKTPEKNRSKRDGMYSDSEMSSSQLSYSSKRSDKGKSRDRRRERESEKKRSKRGSDELSESSSISDIEAKKKRNDDRKAKTTPELGKKSPSEGDRKSKTAADIFNKKRDRDSASTISTGSRASKKSVGSQLQRSASSDSDSESHFSEKHRKVRLSGSFGSDKRSKGDANKGDGSRVDSYAHFPTSIASAIAGAIIAERGLTNVGCQAQSASTSTSKARSQIIDSSVGVSTEALETVPLKFNSDIVKPPEPEKVPPPKDSDSECSHTYTYEYETVEVSGSDNYMYNSDEGGVYNRELKLPM